MIFDFESFSGHIDKASDVNEIKSLLRNSEINVDPNTGSVRRKVCGITVIYYVLVYRRLHALR